VIETVLSVEAPKLPAEQRGAHRSTAKAALHWLTWCRVLVQVEPGRYRWADEFPAWPSRSHAQVQARDAELARQEHDEALRRRDQEQAEQRERTNPNRGLEQRVAAVEDSLAEMQRALSSLARRRDGESTEAALDEKLAAQRAAKSRDTTDPPDHAGEENHEHTTDKPRD
jgi:hypothetical protein